MERRERVGEMNLESPSKISHIRSYIAALLMLVPSMNIQSEDTPKIQQEINSSFQEKIPSIDMNEAIEISDEELFKKAVARSFGPINSLESIPVGGVVLSYEQTAKGTYPKTIDIFPKEMIADKLPYTILQIGEKMFAVIPDMGFEVDEISFDEAGFHVLVTMDSRFGEITKTTSKNKEYELGEYLRKVYSEGSEGRYLGSTVTEIPTHLQKPFLEEFNKLNK